MKYSGYHSALSALKTLAEEVRDNLQEKVDDLEDKQANLHNDARQDKIDDLAVKLDNIENLIDACDNASMED